MQRSEIEELLKNSQAPGLRKECERALEEIGRDVQCIPEIFRIVRETSDEMTRGLAALFIKTTLRRSAGEVAKKGNTEEISRMYMEAVSAGMGSTETVHGVMCEVVADLSRMVPAKDLAEIIKHINIKESGSVRTQRALELFGSFIKKYRTESRSDALYLEIMEVIQMSGELVYTFFQKVLGGGERAHRTVVVLYNIFISFISQDLPAFFEDRIDTFISCIRATFIPDDEEVASLFFEIMEMFSQRYLDAIDEPCTVLSACIDMVASFDRETVSEGLRVSSLKLIAALMRVPSMHGFVGENMHGILEVLFKEALLGDPEKEAFEDEPLEHTRRTFVPDMNFARCIIEDCLYALEKIYGEPVASEVVRAVCMPAASLEEEERNVFIFSAIAPRKGAALHGFLGPGSAGAEYLFRALGAILKGDEGGPGDRLLQSILLFSRIACVSKFLAVKEVEDLLVSSADVRRRLQESLVSIVVYAPQKPVSFVASRLLSSLLEREEYVMTPASISSILGLVGMSGENEFIAPMLARGVKNAYDAMASSGDLDSEAARVVCSEAFLSNAILLVEKSLETSGNYDHSKALCDILGLGLITADRRRKLQRYEAAEDMVYSATQTCLKMDVVEWFPFCFQLLAVLVELTAAPSMYSSLLYVVFQGPLWQERAMSEGLCYLTAALCRRGIIPDETEVLKIFQYLVGIGETSVHVLIMNLRIENLVGAYWNVLWPEKRCLSYAASLMFRVAEEMPAAIGHPSGITEESAAHVLGGFLASPKMRMEDRPRVARGLRGLSADPRFLALRGPMEALALRIEGLESPRSSNASRLACVPYVFR